MSFDEDFYKKIMKMIADLMTPEGQRKIQEFIEQNPDFLKNNPFFMMNNVNPEELKKFMEQLSKNPNIKINFGGFPFSNVPFQDSKTSKTRGNDPITSKEDEFDEIECYWLDDEYHIILNHLENTLKFRTGVHKKTKEKVLIVKDSNDNTLKIIKLPDNINNKKINYTYKNGIYEIIYKTE